MYIPNVWGDRSNDLSLLRGKQKPKTALSKTLSVPVVLNSLKVSQ